MKKWLRGIFLVLIAFAALTIVGGTVYEAIGKVSSARTFPPAGKLIDIAGRRIQLDCRGSGAPTVVFESGLDMLGSLSWSAVHEEVARTTRACAYSRAGILWSDPADTPRSAQVIAEDLHAVLKSAGETGPLVLVGHSLGGPYSVTYTKFYGAEVAGLVFVDASHPDQLKRLEGIGAATRPSTAARRVQEIGAALQWTGIVRAFIGLQERMPNLPEHADQVMKAFAATSLAPMLDEAAALEATLAEAGSLRDLGGRPVFVLTAMAPLSRQAVEQMHLDADQARKIKEIWRELHDEQAHWSTNGQHRPLPEANHYIQFDRPDEVIAAVRTVIEEVRQNHDAR